MMLDKSTSLQNKFFYVNIIHNLTEFADNLTLYERMLFLPCFYKILVVGREPYYKDKKGSFRVLCLVVHDCYT